MNRPGVRILTTSVYATVFALIVIAANRGQLAPIMGFLSDTPGADKLCHFLLVGGLAFAINLAPECRSWFLFGRAWLPGTTICAPFSILEELAQAFIPTRSFDPFDLLMNLFGVMLIGPLARHLSFPQPDVS